MSKLRAIALASTLLVGTQFAVPISSMAKEFKVDCASFEECMAIGDKLTKKRKLSLAQVAYKNAIKFDVNNEDAWTKFEIITIRISEEGGCG